MQHPRPLPTTARLHRNTCTLFINIFLFKGIRGSIFTRGMHGLTAAFRHAVDLQTTPAGTAVFCFCSFLSGSVIFFLPPIGRTMNQELYVRLRIALFRWHKRKVAALLRQTPLL